MQVHMGLLGKIGKIFSSRIGPNTNARNMSRGELFRSGLLYLLFGFFCLVLFVILENEFSIANIFGPRAEWNGEMHWIPFFLSAVLAFFAVIGIGGGIYLVARGVFRKS